MIVKIEIVILFHAVASFRDRDSDRVPLTVRPVPMVKTLKFQNFNGALNSANYQEIKQSSINAFPPAGHESNKGEFSPDRLFSNHPIVPGIPGWLNPKVKIKKSSSGQNF